MKQHLSLATLLAIFASLSFLFSVTIPLSKAPDEYVHFLYARFLAENGRPPLTSEEQLAAGYKSDQPPLYHYLVALVILPIDTSPPPAFKFSWEPHSRQLIDIVLPRALLIRTEDETWPLASVFLAWMAGRWLSIAFGAGTLLLTWLIAQQMFPARPWLGLAAAATLSFTPRFIFTSATLNDDNLIGLLLALFLWRLVLLLKQSAKASTGQFALLGLLLGLAAVTKYSVLLLPLELVVLAIWLARSQPAPVRFGSTRLATAGGVAAVLVGLWVGFVWWHFNQVDELGPLLGLMRPLIAGDASDDTAALISGLLTGQPGEAVERGMTQAEGGPLDWLKQLYQQFFYVPIVGVEPVFPPWLLWATPLLLLGLAALGWRRRWRLNQAHDRLWLGLMLLHVSLFLPLPLLRYALTGQIHDTAQARHLLFPAAPALAILVVAGLVAFFPERRQAWAAALAPSVMLLLSLAHLVYYWTGFPPPLPVRTDPALAVSPQNPRTIIFADGLTFRGFDWEPTDRTLDLTLYWQAAAVPSADYFTEIILHDATDEIALRWLSQPAQGRFPTRAWDAGDSVRDALSIPLAGLDAGDYRLYLRLLDWADDPLPVANSEETDSVLLTTVSLAAQPPVKTVQLWQRGRPIEIEPVFRYRSTIPVTVPENRAVALAGPDGQTFDPRSRSEALSIFLVTHTWPSGQYRLLLDGRPTETRLWIENFEWTFTVPEMMTPVDANFGDVIQLLGYDLPLRRVEPGDGIPLVLYWQSLRQMQADYTIAVQLLDTDLQRRGGYDRIPRETYNTSLWVPGEVVADGFAVPVDSDAPPGVYQIMLGLYQEQAGQPQPLPVVRNGVATGSTSVSVGPIKVGGAPPGVVLSPTQATPNTSLSLELGQPPVIALLGYDLVTDTEMVRVTLYWQSLAQSSIDWTVFVHGRNQAGQTVIQRDGPAGSGLYPASLWEPGEIIADEIAVPLPEDFAPGQYVLVIGLYNLADGIRLPVPDSIHNEIILSRWEFSGS